MAKRRRPEAAAVTTVAPLPRPRAVVIDEGVVLWLRVFDGGRLVVQVPLDVRRAAQLAADLAAAAARRVHDVPNRKGDRK